MERLTVMLEAKLKICKQVIRNVVRGRFGGRSGVHGPVEPERRGQIIPTSTAYWTGTY